MNGPVMNAKEYKISEALMKKMMRRYGLDFCNLSLIVAFSSCLFFSFKKDLPVLATMRSEARKEIVAVMICIVAFAFHCFTLKSSLLRTAMIDDEVLNRKAVL